MSLRKATLLAMISASLQALVLVFRLFVPYRFFGPSFYLLRERFDALVGIAFFVSIALFLFALHSRQQKG